MEYHILSPSRWKFGISHIFSSPEKSQRMVISKNFKPFPLEIEIARYSSAGSLPSTINVDQFN